MISMDIFLATFCAVISWAIKVFVCSYKVNLNKIDSLKIWEPPLFENDLQKMNFLVNSRVCMISHCENSVRT